MIRWGHDDPWEIRDEDAFQALIWSEDPIDTEFLNMLPHIFWAEGIEP